MSNYFHNVLSVSGPHCELEHFVTRNIQIRRDVNHSLAGKIPLFALNAMVPQPADAPLDWADEYWGCRFDTDSIVTLPDMGWNSHCDSIQFAFLAVNAPPYNWFETVAESFPGLHLVMSCVCASSFYAVAFDAQDGQISWTERAGEDFLNNYCTDSALEEAQPPKYQPPADPDRIPIPRGVVTDCDVHDCLLTPLPEETLVAPPDHLLDDVPWSDLSLPGEQETENCSLDDEEFKLPPLRAEDWDHILASVEQEEDIEEAIEAMDAPAPAPAPAALGLGWLFSGSNDIAAFTWRSFCGWPVGVVQDTDDTLHILLCVREQLGLPPLDSMRLLTAPLHEPPAVRPSWDRYAQENLFCLS